MSQDPDAATDPEGGGPPGIRHTIKFAVRTDRGLLRQTNQDSVFAGDRLMVVADGMGGHAAGDAASRMVVDALTPLDEHEPDRDNPADLTDLLTDAVAAGNQAIAEMVRQHPDLDGMGTTVTALYVDGDRAALAHIGDSRAYLYRSGVLHQLTHDDSFVQSLIDEGRITQRQAEQHPQRNLLLRALTGADIQPSVGIRSIAAGDRFVLCSDGLSGQVGPEPFGEALAHPDPDVAADTLVQLALLSGGPDNISVIVVDVIATGEETGGVGTARDDVSPGDSDPDATGPVPRLTREMPRVPLPPIPEEPAGEAELLDGDLDTDLADLDELDEPVADLPDDDVVYTGRTRQAARLPRTERPDSPARRGASQAGEPDDDASDDAASSRAPAPRRRWWRRLLWAAVIIVVVGGGLGGSTVWVRHQYFVGAQANVVGIFRGVHGSLFGLQFATFEETSCGDDTTCTPIKVSDLNQATRHRVRAGIQAHSLHDAREVIARLSDKLLPPCPISASDQSEHTPGTETPDVTCRVVQ